MKKAVLLSVLLALPRLSPAEDPAGVNIALTFRAHVPDDLASFVLHSHADRFTFKREFITKLIVKSDNLVDLAKARELIEAKLSEQEEPHWTVEAVSRAQLTYRFDERSQPPQASVSAIENAGLPGTKQEWVTSNASAMIRVPSTDAQPLTMALEMEPTVETVFQGIPTKPSGLSVDAQKSINLTATHIHLAPVNHSVQAGQLPTSKEVEIAVRTLFSGQSSKVRVIEADSFYVQLEANYIKNVVTSGFWETYVVRVYFYRVSKDVVEYRCNIDGRSAAGLGANEPALKSSPIWM